MRKNFEDTPIATLEHFGLKENYLDKIESLGGFIYLKDFEPYGPLYDPNTYAGALRSLNLGKRGRINFLSSLIKFIKGDRPERLCPERLRDKI